MSVTCLQFVLLPPRGQKCTCVIHNLYNIQNFSIIAPSVQMRNHGEAIYRESKQKNMDPGRLQTSSRYFHHCEDAQ